MNAESTTEHVLTAPPPVRAYAIAAVSSLLGAVLVVLASAQGWPLVVSVVGGVVLAAGVLLALLALILVRRSRTTFRLDTEGYQVRNGRHEEHGQWSEVEQVTLAAGGAVIFAGPTDTHVPCPAPADDPRAQALFADLRSRLDTSRGYRPL